MVTYLSNINDATTDEFDDIPCIYKARFSRLRLISYDLYQIESVIQPFTCTRRLSEHS